MLPNTAACHWVAVYMWATPTERAAIMRFVAARHALGHAVSMLCELRATKQDAGALEQAAGTIRRMSMCFADPARAADGLERLVGLSDNAIFKGLAALAHPACTPSAAVRCTADIVQRVGGKGQLGNLARALCARLAPSLIAAEHMAGIVRLVNDCATSPDSPDARAMVDLLMDAAAAAPSLFAGLLPDVRPHGMSCPAGNKCRSAP